MSDPARILVVEDDDGLQNMMKTALEGAGHFVVQAFDGEDGLSMARSLLPDLILLDLMLPKLDGRDVLAQLKRDPSTSGIPVLILSARVGQSDRIVGLKLGADDYIEKPFSIGMLLNRIEGRLFRASEQR